MPVYFVVVKQHRNPGMFSIWDIVKTIEGNYSPDFYSWVWNTHVGPLLGNGESYQIFVFTREPDNPFKGQAKGG